MPSPDIAQGSKITVTQGHLAKVQPLCRQCGQPIIRPRAAASRKKFCTQECYRQHLKGSTRGTLEERFWKYVRVDPAGCWEWTGSGSRNGGYGEIKVSPSVGRRRATHVSWQIHNGPVPEGLWVLHHCDNPPCVRPDHLFLGDSSANSLDMWRKGRHPKYKPCGEAAYRAVLTWADVAVIRASTETHTALGRRFGVAITTIARARKGITWRTEEAKP